MYIVLKIFYGKSIVSQIQFNVWKARKTVFK